MTKCIFRDCLFYTILVIACSSVPAVTLQNEASDFSGSVEFFLPPVIFAVPDTEANIYFDNLCLTVNYTNYIFDVNCSKGIQQSERWTFRPTSADVGSYPLVIEVRDETNKIIARASTVIRVIPRNAGAGRNITMLLVGDSLTHHSIYSRHLLDIGKGNTEPQIVLIGSHIPDSNHPDNRHEGYGGWTAGGFVTHYTGAARTGVYTAWGSPFLYADSNGKPTLNFERYCADYNNGKKPDFVTILLGANDVGQATDDNINRMIDDMVGYYDKLVNMIHDSSPDTKIGVLLPLSPAASQDAFGNDWKCGLTRWQYKRNQHHLAKRLLERYSGREKENVSVVATNVAIDCVHGYPASLVPWNNRTTEQGVRLNNALHPSESGYRQIGDAIYGWVKACL